MPYKLLYQILFFVSVTVGLWGVWEMISFIRGTANVYRRAIIVLSIGLGAGAIQMITSEIVRGNSVPVNFRVYFTLFTLLLFLLVRFTPLWSRSEFSQSNDKNNTGMATIVSALLIGGIGVLTTHIWVGSSHIAADGYNWVNELKTLLNFCGLGMILSGVALFVTFFNKQKERLKKISPCCQSVE